MEIPLKLVRKTWSGSLPGSCSRLPDKTLKVSCLKGSSVLCDPRKPSKKLHQVAKKPFCSPPDFSQDILSLAGVAGTLSFDSFGVAVLMAEERVVPWGGVGATATDRSQ